jgi:TRAP-type C4-dicarboxylate transport system permease large subunit
MVLNEGGISRRLVHMVHAFVGPVRGGLFFACAVRETTIEKSSREMIPFLVVLCIGLPIAALVPWFTLSLPAFFGLTG